MGTGHPSPDPAADPGRMISVPASEWEGVKKQLADLLANQQLLSAQLSKTAAPPQEEKRRVYHERVPNKEPIREGAARKDFLVELPYCKPAILSVDVVPGVEFAARDEAVREYYKYFGIISSEYQPSVMEWVEPEEPEDKAKEEAKAKAEERTKKPDESKPETKPEEEKTKTE
jgi:hypothetical protein